MDKKKLEEQLKGARFDVIRAKNYQDLLEQPAFMELESEWDEAIQAHSEDKKDRSLFDYSATQIPWGKDQSGNQLYITGQQLLVEQQLEELRIQGFENIKYEIRSRIKRGEDSAVKLKQYNEGLKNKIKK